MSSPRASHNTLIYSVNKCLSGSFPLSPSFFVISTEGKVVSFIEKSCSWTSVGAPLPLPRSLPLSHTLGKHHCKHKQTPYRHSRASFRLVCTWKIAFVDVCIIWLVFFFLFSSVSLPQSRAQPCILCLGDRYCVTPFTSQSWALCWTWGCK